MLYIANWKMNMTLQKVKDFCNELNKHAATESHIIICPSFVHIPYVTQTLKDTAHFVGAQNCSPHNNGSYTGQVPGVMLAQLGCTYCIVGHSETRVAYVQTDELVAQSAHQLLAQNITPIICIGEPTNIQQTNTYAVLEHQLEPIIKMLSQTEPTTIVIAYEPVWAIGTGTTPTIPYIREVVTWIKNHTALLTQHTIKIVYGGSVDEQNVQELMHIQNLNGFLIGGASLDFQKFKKIVGLK